MIIIVNGEIRIEVIRPTYLAVRVNEPIHGGIGVLGGRLRYVKDELSGGIIILEGDYAVVWLR